MYISKRALIRALIIIVAWRVGLIFAAGIGPAFFLSEMLTFILNANGTSLEGWLRTIFLLIGFGFGFVVSTKLKFKVSWAHQLRLAIREKVLGPDHPDVAVSLNNLGVLYQNQGRYDDAEPLYQRALEIREKVLGPDHPDVAMSLDSLGMLYNDQGRYSDAEPLYRRALEICEKVLGPDHPDVANSLNNLGVLYNGQGRYSDAEPLYRRALEICEKVLGPDHPDVANSLNNLGVLYNDQGRYSDAEPLYRRALEIREKMLAPDHKMLDPDNQKVAMSLNNLGVLYIGQGRSGDAEPLYRRALEIREKVLGREHPDVAISLDNLGLLYSGQGRYDDAEPLYRRALEIRMKVLGPEHPDVANSLNNLGMLYHNQGLYGVAERSYRLALEIREKVLGPEHPDVAISLDSLGMLYHNHGRYGDAEPLFRRALEIRETAHGPDHPDVAMSLRQLISLCAATSRPEEAVEHFRRRFQIERWMIGEIFGSASERTRAGYLKQVASGYDGFLSLVWRHLPGSPEAVRAALEMVFSRKALGTEALAAQRDAVLGGRYPHLQPKLAELTAVRRQIAEKRMAGPASEEDPAHFEHAIRRLGAHQDELEQELARQIPEMRLEERLKEVDLRTIAMNLSERGTLIEFVHFQVFDFKAVPARGEPQWLPARYVAFVVPADEPEAVRMVNLDEAEAIDKQIERFRQRLQRKVHSGDALRRLLVDRVLAGLDDRQRRRLILAPDGELTRLPFEVLPLDGGRYVVDDHEISYLLTGRDLLRAEAARFGESGEHVVIADPDFDFRGEASATGSQDSSTLGSKSDLSEGRGLWRREDGRLKRLEASRVEGERVAALLGIAPWLGSQALELRLKQHRSPCILHLATHGLFRKNTMNDWNAGGVSTSALVLAAKEAIATGSVDHIPVAEQIEIISIFALLASNDGNRDLERALLLPALERLAGAPSMRHARLAWQESPLLRSGLALAGANTWLFDEEVLPEEAGDGLLTGEDVTGLDLLDTEMVVLSACDTGLGDVRTGEGVLGLRHAFIVAGAKTLIMSLWSVPDLPTAILMERFYNNLDGGMPRHRALNKAQHYVRTLNVGNMRNEWLTPEMIERLVNGGVKMRHLGGVKIHHWRLGSLST